MREGGYGRALDGQRDGAGCLLEESMCESQRFNVRGDLNMIYLNMA